MAWAKIIRVPAFRYIFFEEAKKAPSKKDAAAIGARPNIIRLLVNHIISKPTN